MGNGVPNGGPWPHFSGDVLSGYQYIYHDQKITGDAYVRSPEVGPGVYGMLRTAAAAGLPVFQQAVLSSPWAPFFQAHPGINWEAARLGVLLVH